MVKMLFLGGLVVVLCLEEAETQQQRLQVIAVKLFIGNALCGSGQQGKHNGWRSMMSLHSMSHYQTGHFDHESSFAQVKCCLESNLSTIAAIA